MGKRCRTRADKLDPARTLEALYLRPLWERARSNRGRVHPFWPHSVQLVVDIKSDGPTTYAAVHEALRRYRQLFTTFVSDRAYEGAVTAVISGNRPRELMAAQRVRFAGYDGQLSDLGTSNAGFMPLVSDSWSSHFTWLGAGPMRTRSAHAFTTCPSRMQGVSGFASGHPETARRERSWSELVELG